MTPNRRRTALLFAGLCTALLLPVAACGGSADSEEPPALSRSNTPDVRTYNPTPSPEGKKQSSTIRLGSQDRVSDLRISVSSTKGGRAALVVSAGPGIDADKPEKVSGGEGDTVTLDNGYRITIEKVTAAAKDDPVGGGSGSVRVTVAPPE